MTWTIEPHDGAMKHFTVEGPNGVRLYADYDDVDHKMVDREVERMVEVLNGYGYVINILERLAQPTSQPRGLDAQLLQDEVAVIATQALGHIGAAPR